MQAEIQHDGKTVTLSIPMQIKRPHGRRMIILPEGSDTWLPPEELKVDDTLIKAFARAYRWKRLLEQGQYNNINDLAEGEKINESYCSRIFRLTMVSPDIVAAILDGRQPKGLLLSDFMKPFPELWTEQRKLWGL